MVLSHVAGRVGTTSKAQHGLAIVPVGYCRGSRKYLVLSIQAPRECTTVEANWKGVGVQPALHQATCFSVECWLWLCFSSRGVIRQGNSQDAWVRMSAKVRVLTVELVSNLPSVLGPTQVHCGG